MSKRGVIIAAMTVILLSLSGCGSNKYMMSHQTTEEPVCTEETKPSEKKKQSASKQELIIYQTPEKYTYDNLMFDVAVLQEQYGDIVQPVKVCDTVDGRNVCDIIVGDQQSDNQILIMGAMHAREYITAQIVMRQLCDYLRIVSEEADGEYNSISKKALSEGITVHFIPMSNPDGVSISQFGLEGIVNQSVRDFISSISNGDYEQWKSNAEGIDLNRNFDAGWDEYIGSAGPSSDKYKGKFPGSSYEAAGLIKLTEEYGFKRTISYHTCGALIYWYYKQIDTVLEQSKLFAQQISDETGYTLDSNYQAVDAAGYKDWAVYKMGIPSITIEVGNETGHGIINPVPISFFDSIWDRNKDVVYAAIYNLKYGTDIN